MDLDVAAALPDEPSPRRLSIVARNKLKILLVLCDAAAIMTGYGIGLILSHYSGYHGPRRSSAWLAAALATGLWSLRSQGLFLSRVSAVRVVEITRIARAVVVMTALMILTDRVLHFDFNIYKTVRSSLITLIVLVAFRGIYRSWLSAARERGQFGRPVVLIGADAEAVRLLDLFGTHKDLGIQVVGIIGSHVEADRRGLNDLWLGELDDAEELTSIAHASGVVVSPNGVPSDRLNDLIRNFHAVGIHVHLATGISGIDARRMRSMPLAHEPLIYVEAPSLSKAQLVAKRVLDTALASIALIVLFPVLAVVAVAVKVDDRHGPVFFTQRRVGRGGKEFGVRKFRSMRVGAEKQLASLAAANERQGPLFKMVDDPRVTRVGRFLRESSLDELPQLINVIRGEMSLVGPRPALPSEVANFSSKLRAREQVMPGITGLWQVEARDNPSFEAYRRLDLFYVENWSITLDLLIIVGTMEQVLSRLLSTVISRGKKVAAAEVDAAGPEALAGP